ncbi:hypothetical protein [Terricaulis silvestris]|uniref:Uncharacterized protein n=1 Tax=Terricaulis silvestris TaxID=2686094 RepID=A0A6I6MJR6_9CAUL|nr:hypothetical protein [Terricaulis silvestris]QGZ94141.1 hypothetical protein DSM104635_00957 [Terricaulis silvestris]
MLASIAKPVFVTACACNLAFSVIGIYGFESHRPASFFVANLGGGLAFAVAAALAFLLLRESPSMDRPWIKAALVFLVLGPLAFWGLQMPAAAEAICIDQCHGADSATIQARAVADIVQSQIAMIVVALAATFCAARAMAAMLDDLAV